MALYEVDINGDNWILEIHSMREARKEIKKSFVEGELQKDDRVNVLEIGGPERHSEDMKVKDFIKGKKIKWH